jgi:putative PIN family toxin of toxin-antitoxin system
MRVFLDTNVLASAAGTRGLCLDVLLEVFASHQLVLSEYVLEELQRALTGKFKVPLEVADDFVRLLRQDGVIVKEGEAPSVELMDKTDVPVLAAAINGKADVIVTGDGELQDLGQVGDVQILSPRGFWERLRTQQPPEAADSEESPS